MKTKFILFANLLCLTAVVFFINKQSGSNLYFFIYNLTSMALLSLIFYSKSEFFQYGSALVLLGTWSKIWLGIFLPDVFCNTESIGQFNFSSKAWDEVYLVCTIGNLALIFVGILFIYSLRTFRECTYFRLNSSREESSSFFGSRVFFITTLLTLVLAVSNYLYHFNIVGISSPAKLPLHLDKLLSLLLIHGCVTFILFQISPKYSSFVKAAISVIAIGTLSVSRLSRAVVFQLVPIVRHSLLAQKGYFKLVSLCLVILFVIFGSSKLANTLRPSVYSQYTDMSVFGKTIFNNENIVLTQRCGALNASANKDGSSELHFYEASNNLWKLMILRWVGLEGVLAVQSSNIKSAQSFREALLWEFGGGYTNYYDSKVTNSIYNITNNKNTSFGNIPGIYGFLFISGSLTVVFLGVSLLFLMAYLIETLYLKLTNNIISASYLSITLGLYMSQYGNQPIKIWLHIVAIFMMGLVAKYVLAVSLFKFKGISKP